MGFLKRRSKTIIVLAIVVILTVGSLGLYNHFKKKGS